MSARLLGTGRFTMSPSDSGLDAIRLHGGPTPDLGDVAFAHVRAPLLDVVELVPVLPDGRKIHVGVLGAPHQLGRAEGVVKCLEHHVPGSVQVGSVLESGKELQDHIVVSDPLDDRFRNSDGAVVLETAGRPNAVDEDDLQIREPFD